DHQLSLARFLECAGGSGFIDYPQMEDGTVRNVPLWVRYRGRLYPQIGLTMVCAHLSLDLEATEFSSREIRIPRDNGPPLRIPVRPQFARDRGASFGFFFDIPWMGPPGEWLSAYDRTGETTGAQHLSATQVWTLVETRQRLQHNRAIIKRAVSYFYELFYPDRTGTLARTTAAQLEPIAEGLLADDFIRASVDSLSGLPPEELDQASRQMQMFYRTLTLALEANQALDAHLVKQQAELRGQIADKSVLVGFTALGVEADVVPTSLYPNKAPGVVLHGAIFNALMTGEMWTLVPAWIEWLITAILGMLTAVAVGRLAPVLSLAVAAAFVAAWAGFNGLVLFDYGNLLLAPAGPLVAIPLAWSSTTLFRYLDERAERARLTERFRSYVDPVLVNYVLEHPEMKHFEGELKYMTVVFTDLAGFTTLSEKLGSRTVSVLNRYMSYMVPLIRAHHGYLNKFLGDGIMFFYGAPRPNPDHALDAVRTILEIQRVMQDFNAELAPEGLGPLTTRAGVSTGEMIVGDAGPPDASDYTVLGDTVNLAARLESANKAFGTTSMISAATAVLLDNKVLVRPLGILQVIGKTEGVKVFEPLAIKEEATEAQRELSRVTEQAFDAFVEGRFGDCLEALELLEAFPGQAKLVEVYRTTCTDYLVAVPENFSGQLVLTSK
ncbi:MAG: adenylate/guanylate cyclase domain-containing protein, partial [Opitutales bacterium]